MQVYMTEEEQLEVIKRWWRSYGSHVLLALSLVFLGIGIYRYWFWHQQKERVEASHVYEQLMNAVAQHDANSVQSFANLLMEDHKKSVYADAARLSLARQYVDENKLDKARDLLNTSVSVGKNEVLKEIALIRMARIEINEKKWDSALKTLSYVKYPAFSPVVQELRGDIFALTGETEKALKIYRDALNEIRLQGVQNSYLEMKASELAGFSKG